MRSGFPAKILSEEVLLVPPPWRKLIGPARWLSVSATLLLIASALGGIEAGVLLILGPARDFLLKPFVIAGYLEACAMFFSLIFIVVSIVCLIFYHPYLYIRRKLARRAPQDDEDNSWSGSVYQAPGHSREEDGAPD